MASSPARARSSQLLPDGARSPPIRRTPQPNSPANSTSTSPLPLLNSRAAPPSSSQAAPEPSSSLSGPPPTTANGTSSLMTATPKASTSVAQVVGSPSSVASSSKKRARGRPSQPTGGAAGASLAADVAFKALPLPRYELVPGTQPNSFTFRFAAGVTDGSRDLWPVGDADYRPTEAQSKKWSLYLGQGTGNTFAKLLKIDETKNYAFERLPDGYSLFTHRTTPKSGPRDDVYLLGSTTKAKKFRSPNEFLPHLVWLLTSTNDNNKPCVCKYCGGVNSQDAVNRQLGIADAKPKTETIYKSNGAQLKKPRVENRFSPQPTYLGSYTNPRMLSELMDKSIYRHSELVWVKLDAPLRHSTQPEFDLTHWPAIVAERRLKVQSDMVGPLPATDAPKFVNRQTWAYEVQPLALNGRLIVDEADIRPWLGLSSRKYSQTDFASDSASRFVFDGKDVLLPGLAEFNGESELAMTAYALALQIVANIIIKFSHNDAYTPEDGHLIVADTVELNEAELKLQANQLNAPHFQSVWWGPEHIYAGELVRVLVQDELIDPNSSRTRSEGSHSRALLFKIKSFFRSPADDGEAQVCMMTGSLVELVKLDSDTATDDDRKKEEADAVEEQPSVALPEPPRGHRFRVLTHPTTAVHLDLEYLAGRYYALPDRLDSDPDRVELIANGYKRAYAQVQATVDEQPSLESSAEIALSEDQLALALAGLLPAEAKYIRATSWSDDRRKTLIHAEITGNEDMIAFFGANRAQ